MAEPPYTVFVRVPMPRGDFIDPPPVNWDSNKDDTLWKILSGAAKKEIDWNEVADRFEVPVDFLLQQVAFLTERHASQVRAQVRKATAAARGSAAPSPVPGAEPTGLGHQRAPSSLSIRKDSPMPRGDLGSGSGTPLNLSIRPIISRNTSTNTTVLREMASGSASPRPGMGVTARGGEHRRRLSSLPLTSNTTKPLEQEPQPMHSPAPERSPSPDPAEDSSTATSDDESSPAQSRIIRRPPRFQQHDAGPPYEDDDDDESEPAFQPYKSPDSNQTSAGDLGSTLRGDGRSKRFPRSLGKAAIHRSQTSDSSASSAAIVHKPGKSRELRQPGPLSPRHQAELAAQSPGSKSRGYSREGSDGTPSMGSSFSDLDDASVTQSALEEAMASQLNRGAGSRFSISQAWRSRYTPSSNQ